ncbi:MAG: hypothetical protein V4662_22710 [Verrucomicrobiota bacterium]
MPKGLRGFFGRWQSRIFWTTFCRDSCSPLVQFPAFRPAVGFPSSLKISEDAAPPSANKQLIAIYCRSEALAEPGRPLNQFLQGVEQTPMPVDDDALVISDNGDIYGTLTDLWERR